VCYQSPYFSACGTTFVLLIVAALVPGILSATDVHPMAAKRLQVANSYAVPL